MTRPRSLIAVAASLLALAGCGGSHTNPMTSGATRRASTTPTATTGRGEHAAASLFGAAYVRFLDGIGAASGLPDATPGVRALAARGGSIPATRRRGTLLMTQLRAAIGATGSYLLTARDDTHAFYAQLTIAEQHGHWLVVELTPPDFVQVFAPAGPPSPAPPPGSAGAEDAARLFLLGYLPWLYGHAPLRTITGATSRLLASLKTHPPRVPPRSSRSDRRSRRSRCSAAAAADRRFRTSTTDARPTSSCSRSRRPAGDGLSATSTPRDERPHQRVDTP